jgi:ABC-type transport system substrate-binding protein
VSIEQGVQVKDQWPDGKIVPSITGWTMIYPQLRASNPAALLDPDFRRALIMSIDREQLAETLAAGLAPVAHSIISPDDAAYAAVESSIVRWPYDVRRAAQLIEGMGFSKGQDGNPVQRLQDNEYRATYPGLELVNQPHGTEGIVNLLDSSAAPLPERNYRAPNKSRNRGQYVNLTYDALMERYLTTVPTAERMQMLGQILHQQLVMGLYYGVDAIMMANRLEQVPPGSGWNAHQWDLRR